MEQINHFSEVLQYLKDKEIVCIYNKRVPTYFYVEHEVIRVHNPNCRYVITFKEFADLFGKENFYLYKPTEEGIDQQKDEAYYAWKSKNAN